MLAQLEKNVIAAIAVVKDWTAAIARIETQLNTANTAVFNAKKVREAHALKAAMGDTAAIAAVKQARTEQNAAEQTIEDLKHALPGANAQLAEAQKREVAARHELARFEATRLAQERVKVAARMDTLIADFSAAIAEFDKLGTQIANMPGLLPTNAHMHGASISRNEEIQGHRRVRAALPQVWIRFFPGALHEESPKVSLETSEIRIWSALAQIETAKAA